MQEEMTQQSLALSFKAVEMTADLLYTALKTLLEDDGKGHTKGNAPKLKQGKQSVKKLIGQGKGVESIDINSKNIGLFTASARKYGVDFAMTKDKSTDLTNDTIDIKVSRLGKTYDEITVQAVDIAGNKSKVVTVKNPNYKDDSKDNSLNQQASTTTQPTAGTGTTTTAPTSSQGASTTSTAASSGTSSENSTSASGSGESSEAPLFGTFEDTQKQFMSIVTKDGAVYYLIIDHDKESENVYFLSEVTNAELASFTPQGEAIAEDEEYPEFIGEQPKEEEIGFIDDTPKIEESTDDTELPKNEVPSEPADGGSTGTYILMAIAILGVGGAGYYFKIYKPKKELESSDDLDDFTFAEDEDDYIFSDEDLDKDVQDDSNEIIFEE